MRVFPLRLAILVLVATLLGACAPRVLPEFRGVVLESVQPDFDAAALSLGLGLRYRFYNPLDRELTVPEHQFTLELDGQALPGTPVRMDAFSVPADGSVDVTYRLDLDLAPGGPLAALGLLGRDVPYAFVADIVLELPFGAPSQSATLRFEDSLRLPLLPTLALDASPNAPQPSVTLLGDVDTIDLGPIRDGMAPFVALALGLGDTLVPLLAPIFYGPFPSEAQSEELTQNWEAFKEAWQDLDAFAPLPDFTSSDLEGIAVVIPLVIRNPNTFPISAPSFSFELGLAGQAPLAAVRARYQNPNGEIPPGNAPVRVFLESELRWTVFGDGLLALLSGQSQNVRLDGSAEVDLGYGLVRVPVSLQSVPLGFGP